MPLQNPRSSSGKSRWGPPLVSIHLYLFGIVQCYQEFLQLAQCGQSSNWDSAVDRTSGIRVPLLLTDNGRATMLEQTTNICVDRNWESAMVPLLASTDVSAGHGLDRSNSPGPVGATASLPPDRGGLKNGNRSGDLLAAARCGAKTRAGGCCRQPAMRKGRCRLHGGLSTGPRTPAGLDRSRRARFIHGGRSAQVRALLRETRLQARRTRALPPASAAVPLGMGFIARIQHLPRPVLRSQRFTTEVHSAAVGRNQRESRMYQRTKPSKGF